jgi:mRNA interferase MazF
VARPKAGDLVIVDWRGGAAPKEPNRPRPGVVVEDTDLFDSEYMNLIVVPLTTDTGLAIADLAVTIDPSPENGCERRCFALAPSVTSVSVSRVRGTGSRVQTDQLLAIHRRIAEAIGIG